MATMVKEKRREKKKSKEKLGNKSSVAIKNETLLMCEELPHVTLNEDVEETPTLFPSQTENILENNEHNIETSQISVGITQHASVLQPHLGLVSTCFESDNISENTNIEVDEHIQSQNLHSDLSLEEMPITDAISLGSEANEINSDSVTDAQSIEDNVIPSAPVFEDETPQVICQNIIVPVVNEVIRLKCMTLEEAVKQFEGAEIGKIMAMSEIERAVVDTGPTSGPDHSLVDLLSTFRRSLIAVDRERTQLTIGYAEEAKFRSTLWRIEKKVINDTQKCHCGLDVYFKVRYDHAELQNDKLPIARMKLEALLRDVQESYCHHQHAALLAHCQIEEFISEIVKSNKGDIREALSLVLQALKLSDSGPAVLAGALQRWASELAYALVDQRDFRQLLFLIHHLFRQTRSVRWAASVINITVSDAIGAARVIALMEVLFARTTLEAAVECVEAEKDDEWEEVDKDGSGGAVSEGTLRERDLLALFHALPLRDLVARIMLFTQSDIREAREYTWGVACDARGVLRACCGVRVLLRVMHRVLNAHANYTHLRAEVQTLVLRALHALAALHEHARSSNSRDMEYKILGELQAVFVSGLEILDPNEIHELPATLLADHAARDYYTGHMVAAQDHGDHLSPRCVESLSIELPTLTCSVRVRIVSRAAVHRRNDYELARLVLDFLFQVGVRRNSLNTTCKGACRQTARDSMSELLEAHSFLYPIALHLIAETNPVEKLEPSSLESLCLEKWRPQCGEVRAVLDDWAQRCPQLVEPMLLRLDYEPHVGVCLDSQLAIGRWLCGRPAEAEWRWRVLRRLRLHRAAWGPRLPPPPDPDPDPDPGDLFSMAFALMASSWGHCIPLICSDGVEALCALAATRASDALHCFAPIALILASSPESVAATPKFTELFGLVANAGPSVMQRALGRGPPSGADLLQRLLLAHLREQHVGGVSCEALLGVWLSALWALGAGVGGALLEPALCARPRLPQLRRHADGLALAQDEQSQQQILQAMKWSAQSPLITESALHAWHSQREVRTQLFPRLLDALHAQRTASQRIHVDNALKMLRVTMNSEDLVIYRTAAAVQTAPTSHPAHLLLWRLLMHLYLQRPPCDARETTPPVGPLFFSGLIKSRSLAQLKRRIQENIKYHGNEATRLKNKQKISPQKPSTSRSKSKSITVDSNLTSPLSMRDLTGVSSGSSESDTNEEDEDEISEETEDNSTNDVINLLAYHVGAERLLCEYARWLDEGEKTRALPHHADVARFISEQALDAAFRQEAGRRKPVLPSEIEPLPLPPALPPPPAAPKRTPFQDAKDILLKIKQRTRRRCRRRTIKSPVEDLDFKDARTIISVVDKHLRDIEQLAQEWCTEVAVVGSLDSALWPLVRGLRVARPLPAVRAACASKCKPTAYIPQGQEWCISTGAEQGIKENRSSALAAVRKLARARPTAARRAAALLAIARRLSSVEVSRRVAERTWQCAASVSSHCAPAADLVTSLFELLAERWLASDAEVCAELVSRWCGGAGGGGGGGGAGGAGPLQQRLLGALLAPQRLRPARLPLLHAALLRAALPPHALFSYLSKFELASWSQAVDSAARRSLLESLTTASQRWGPAPDEDHQLLLELIGVQTAAVCGPAELCEVVRSCARACAQRRVPPPHLRHLAAAAARCAPHVPYDQLGHLLRELGVIWWEARAGRPGRDWPAAALAPPAAGLLRLLHAAFVAAAVRLSYAPEKVATVAWSSLQESWSAWILPHTTPPLLSAVDNDSYADMLKQFTTAVRQVMDACPGSEVCLLANVFEWAIQTHGAVYASVEQETRVQMSALLAELAALPWSQHQWLRESSIQAMLQISQCADKEMLSWCGPRCAQQAPRSWLSGAAEPAARLPALLYLFTASPIAFHQQTLQTACLLPWSRLPEVALDEALERFFTQNHGLATPYHELPQFRVILSASEMYSAEGVLSGSESSKQKRARVTSLWTLASSAPALAALASSHAAAMLAMLADIAPLVDSTELEELLERALAIMCIEPAASAVAPTWEKFITSSNARMLRASLQAIAGLTVFEHFATLADAAIKTHLSQESGEWVTVVCAWQRCVWADPTPLCARARLHAAYATHARTDGRDYAALRTALLALLAADINFTQNEEIVAVWICVSCRAALRCGAEAEAGECAGAARGLLARWAARRPLLSLGGDSARPTPRQRLLCLFAQCVLSPGDETVARTYESACSSLLNSSPEVATWGKSPHPRRLSRLAIRLYPQAEKYFKREMELMPEDTV